MRLNSRPLSLILGVLLPVAVVLAPPQEGVARDDDVRTWMQPTPLPGRQPTTPIAPESVIPEDATRPRSQPVLVAAANGASLLCSAWRAGDLDQLELHATRPASPDAPRHARELLKAPVELLDPVATRDAQGRLVIAWTELVDGLPRIVVGLDADGSSAQPRPATRSLQPEGNAALALHRGRVWLAWESESTPPAGRPARRQIFIAPLDDDGAIATEPLRIGDGDAADREPTLASAPDALWIAWSRCDGADREIVARPFAAERAHFGDPIVVSNDPIADDRHVALAIAPDGTPWLAWDRIEITHRGAPAPAELSPRRFEERLDVSVRCACIRASAVLRPQSPQPGVPPGMVPGAALFSTGGGQPQLAFDVAGRLWITYRALEQLPLPNGVTYYGFPLLLHHLGPEGWSPPLALTPSAGPNEAGAIVADGDGVVVACQVDHRFDRNARARREIPASLQKLVAPRGVTFSWWVGPASIAIGRADATSPPGTPPLIRAPDSTKLPPARSFLAPAASNDPYVNGSAHFEVARDKQRFVAWYGDLHRHSSISRCSRGVEPTPTDRWSDGRDLFASDFMALTDHDGALDPASWWLLDKLGWASGAPGFVPLLGYEWSTNTFGHVNVIRAGRMDLPANADDEWPTLHRQLDPTQALVIPHHPADAIFPSDFDDLDDDVTRLIELFQACRGNFEFDGCFLQSSRAVSAGSFAHDALARGRRFGFIASTDHGYGASWAGVLAEKLDRASLFAALRARRTFAATAKGLFVDFRVADALMGEETTLQGPATITLRARGTAPLADVALFRNGERFREATPLAPLPANRYAPVLLHVECGARKSAETAALTVTTADDASFVVWDGAPARRRAAPPLRFRVASDDPRRATLSGTAGSDDARAKLHWYCVGDAPLTFTTTGGALAGGARTSVAQLLATPFCGTFADGTAFTIRLDVRDARIDLAHGLDPADFRVEWNDPDPPRGRSWYYARFIQTDGEIAWSSPIFVTRE